MTRDYYCNNKFKFLKVDLEKAMTYNCHAAKPHKIDFEWLQLNPGQIFNNPTSVHERILMLDNKRNTSCEQNCWPAEDNGQFSVRMLDHGFIRTHFDPITQPEILDITLDTDCNLKCVYCCKEYSSSWRIELEKYGDFDFQKDDENFDRYSLKPKDRLIQILSQKQKQNSNHAKILLEEIGLMVPNLNLVIITGGEPFLSSQLTNILELLKTVPKVKIFTGLGISLNKLDKVLKIISNYTNVFLAVSAEAIDETYNFLRYNSSFTEFEKKLNLIIESKIEFEFHSTLTNIGVISFFEFYRRYQKFNFTIDFVHTPKFLSVNVLDYNTKEQVLDFCNKNKGLIFDQIHSSVKKEPTIFQRVQLKVFLDELQYRRKININFLNKDFMSWILLNT